MSVTQASGTFVAAFFIAVVLLVAIYDVVAGSSANALQPATAVLRDWSGRYPILPLTVGVVVGHLFW